MSFFRVSLSLLPFVHERARRVALCGVVVLYFVFFFPPRSSLRNQLLFPLEGELRTERNIALPSLLPARVDSLLGEFLEIVSNSRKLRKFMLLT